MRSPRRAAVAPFYSLLAVLWFGAVGAACGQAAKPRPSPSPVRRSTPPPAAAPAAFVLPEVVAEFNGAQIHRAELEKPAEALLANQGRTSQNVSAADQERVYRTVLDSVLASRLLALQTAGETVPDADVDKQFNAFRAQYPDQAAFDADLQKNGQTADGLRATLRLQLAQQQWVERQIADEVKVTPQEVEKFYKAGPPDKFDAPEAVHASHLLVAVRKDAPPEDALDAEQKADDLAARARKGESFEALAKQSSDDPRAKTTGGDLGFITRGKIMPEFADVAFKLKKGEVGGPVRTQLGYHVIKVQEHDPAHTATLNEVRDQITVYLQSAKRDAAVAKLLQGLRNQAKIEVFLPERS